MARKVLAILLALCMILPAVAFAQSETAAVPAKNFYKATVEEGSFYIYKAAEFYNPGPMLTPVIYVYPDQPYADEAAVLDAITNLGLVDIAEAEHGVVIVPERVGDAYDRDDIDLYEGIMKYTYFLGGTEPLTWDNLQYVIGEGAGATFINNYVTQNCKRIAAVLTFGGEIGSPYPLYALPAYIVSGSQAAVDFYVKVNSQLMDVPTSGRVAAVNDAINAAWKTTETDEKITKVYTADPVKKVIVSKKEATSFDKDIIADAWESLLRYTARPCMTKNFWGFAYTNGTYNNAEFTLYERPNYKAANMDVIKVEGTQQTIWPSDANNYWYEFVPSAVKNAMENNTGEKYSLIVCFHGGGDHPIYEAESIGWAQLCIDHNIIMVAPNSNGADESKALIEYMINKYPIDTSRIYAAGFSGGASSTLLVSNKYPELFAAVAPMDCVSGPFYTNLLKNITNGKYDYDIDLPIAIVGQGKETESTNWNDQYVWNDAVQIMRNINEVPASEGKLDFEKYPYWGFPVEDNERTLPGTGFAIWHGVLKDKDGIPMLAAFHSETITHIHYPAFAELLYNYFVDFTRNPVTHEIQYNPLDLSNPKTLNADPNSGYGAPPPVK